MDAATEIVTELAEAIKKLRGLKAKAPGHHVKALEASAAIFNE